MGFIYFVVDNCASMNQTVAGGVTLLDLAKSATELFMKTKIQEASMDPDRNQNVFIILSYDGQRRTVNNTGFRANYEQLMSSLKYIQALGSSKLDQSLRETFSVINMHRLGSGIETFTFGRIPFFNEMCLIVVLTTPHSTFLRPNSSKADLRYIFEGSQLYSDPHRWDERVVCVTIDSSSEGSRGQESSVNGYAGSLLHDLCACTCGYIVPANSVARIVYEMNRLLDRSSCPQLTIKFIPRSSFSNSKNVNEEGESKEEKSSEQTIGGFHSLVAVPVKSNASAASWPVPEAYMMNPQISEVPPRSGIPNVFVDFEHPKDRETKYLNPEKYLIQNGPFKDFLMEVSNKEGCYDCFIVPSSTNDPLLARPFGYIHVNPDHDLAVFNILVMDFAFLAIMIDQCINVHKGDPPIHWVGKFETYVASLPFFYLPPLKELLVQFGISSKYVRDPPIATLNPSMATYLKRLKMEGKNRLEAYFYEKESIFVNSAALTEELELCKVPEIQCKVKNTRDVLCCQKIEDFINPTEVAAFISSLLNVKPLRKCYIAYENLRPFHNPFDVETENLEAHLQKMKCNLLNYFKNVSHRIMDEDAKHKVAISTMGDYKSRVREVDPDKVFDPNSVKAVNFGSPYKNRSVRNFSADEADIQITGKPENSRSTFYKIRMHRRRKTLRIREDDHDLSKESSLSEGSLLRSSDDFHARGASDPSMLTLPKSFYILHQKPYRDYLQHLHNELRDHRPNISILKDYFNLLEHMAPVQEIFLLCVKDEAERFSQSEFVRYIAKKLKKIRNDDRVT